MSALQDIASGMTAEQESSPDIHLADAIGVGSIGNAGEEDDGNTARGLNRWLSDKSVGQKLWAIASTNMAVVLLCLLATCLGGYFALQARAERMTLSAAAVTAERMVADINTGRLFVQRYAVSGEQADLAAAQDAFNETDRDLARLETHVAAAAPAVLPQVERLDTMLAALRSRVKAAELSRGTQAQWQAFSDSVYGEGQDFVDLASATRSEIEDIGATADAESRTMVMWLFVAFFTVTALALGIAWTSARFIGRDVSGTLRRMTDVASRLARGEKDIHIPATGRRDEIGDLARSLEVFLQAAWQVERMSKERDALRRERGQEMVQFAKRFEATVGEVVNGVASASAQLKETAGSMAATAEQASLQTNSPCRSARSAARPRIRPSSHARRLTRPMAPTTRSRRSPARPSRSARSSN